MIENTAKYPSKKVVLVIFCLTVVIVGGCTKPSPVPSPTTTSVSIEYVGRVLDKVTGLPIDEAKVTLDFQSAPPIVYTDSEGVYRFAIRTESSKIAGRVIVEADGYEKYDRNIALSIDASMIEDIRLVSLEPTPTETLEATPTHALQSTSTNTPSPEPINTPTTGPVLTDTPTSVASSDSNWHGEYFDNDEWLGQPAYEREDAAIAFNWGAANPAPGIDYDYFGVRWTRCLDFEERYYTFTGQANDYMKVWLDDTVLLSRDGSQEFYVTGGQHCLKIEYREASGNASVSFDFKASEQPTPVASSDSNWHGEYFDNDEWLGQPAYEREDAAIAFNWGAANPAPGIDYDYFGVRWTRCLDFEERYYTFTGQANDYMKVWLDDTVLLSRDGSQEFYVTGGQHCLKIEYREASGNASVSFDFKTSEQPTPVASSDSNWHGEYFDNDECLGQPAYEREDAAIAFNWGAANPAPGIDYDYFSVRWTRCLDFEERYYTFTGQANDYMKVWLDDAVLLSRDGSQEFYVTGGQHCLKIEYREASGNASVSFDFKAN